MPIDPDGTLPAEVFTPYRFYSCKARTLLVWFGGLHEPFMSESLAEETGCDCLCLRDERQVWYSDGLFDPHADAADAVAFLKAFIAARAYESVVMCGQSSGGYAALYYAWHCGANLCIAFSPQTANHFDGQCRMVPHVPIADLGQLYRPDGRVRLVLNAAVDESDHESVYRWDDWRHIRRLSHYPLATVVTHPYHGHNVTVELKREGLLYRFIRGQIAIYAAVSTASPLRP